MTASLGAAEACAMTVDIPPGFFGAATTPGGASSMRGAAPTGREHAAPLHSQQSVDSGAAVAVAAAALQLLAAQERMQEQDTKVSIVLP